MRKGKVKVDDLIFTTSEDSIRAEVPLKIKKFNSLSAINLNFIVDTGANNTCISVDSLFRLGYTEDYLCRKFNFSDYSFVTGCTGDKVKAFKLDIGDIDFNGFKLVNFSVTVIDPTNYSNEIDRITALNEQNLSIARILNNPKYLEENFLPPRDLPNIIGLDVLKYFNIDLECPYYDRRTCMFDEFGGYLYIRLGSKYYEEFRNQTVLGIQNEFKSNQLIYFEDSMDVTYSDNDYDVTYGDIQQQFSTAQRIDTKPPVKPPTFGE